MIFLTQKQNAEIQKMKFFRSIRFCLGCLIRNLKNLFVEKIGFLKIVRETQNHTNPITLKMFFKRKIFPSNKKLYWPISKFSSVSYPQNIQIGVDTSPGYSQGCYIQAIGKIFIGDYTGISPNVAIISSNHSLLDFRKHEIGEVRIGKYCWLGYGCVILPNVTIGDFTIVRPNSVVNKSFKGYCIIGGNPAKVIKEFPETSHKFFKRYKHDNEYIGYIKKEDFKKFKEQNLNV